MVVAIAVLAIGLSLAMAAAWQIALRTGKSGWIDAMWSLATGLAGVAAAIVPLTDGGLTSRQMLVAVMVAFWSLRLGTYIARRTARGGDDPRYHQLRVEWGAGYAARLFRFLQIQALVGLALALTVMIAARNPAPGLTIFDVLGAIVLLAAVAGETLADRQLAAFRSDAGHRGRICDIGLWGVSRHPNYFFEWLGWIAYALIAIGPSAHYPWGWLALAGPGLMYWLLVHASGIPPLEAHMRRSRGHAFEDYQQRVNAFWPGPSKDPAPIRRQGPVSRSSRGSRHE